MIRCDRSQNLFARAWDDELSVSERESLESHLSACTSCRREYDEYARTLELVQALPRPAVSVDFAARVLSEARRRETETKHVSRLGRPGWAFGLAPRPAMALAAAFAVAVGIGAIVRFAPTRGTDNAPAPLVATAVEPAKSEPSPAPAPVVVSAPNSESGRVATVAPTESRTSREPIPRPATAGTRVPSSPASVASSEMAAVPDSLFDHTADVELVLDPVQMRRERGRGYTPVQTTVRGEAASITF